MPAIMTGTWEGENCMKVRLLASASAAAFILLSGTALAQTASSQTEHDSNAPASSDAQTHSAAGTGAHAFIVTATPPNHSLTDVPPNSPPPPQLGPPSTSLMGFTWVSRQA